MLLLVALVGQPQHGVLDEEPRDLVSPDRVVDRPQARRRPRGKFHEAVDRGAAGPLAKPRACAGEHRAFVHEHGAGDRPSCADGAEPVLVGDQRAIEEHLVELAVPGYFPQRANGHPRLPHIEQEGGDALVLRDRGVGAGEQDPASRLVREAAPQLLPADPPALGRLHRAGGEASQVGTRAWLAEQLAPDLRVVGDRGQQPLTLGLGSVLQKSGRSEGDPDDVQGDQPGRAQLFPDHVGGRLVQPEPPILAGPRGRDETGPAENGIPAAVGLRRPDLVQQRQVARSGRIGPCRRNVGGYPGPNGAAQAIPVGRVGQPDIRLIRCLHGYLAYSISQRPRALH